MGRVYFDDDGYARLETDPVPEALGLPLCRWCAGQVYEGMRNGLWFHRLTGSSICDGQEELPYRAQKKAEPLVWTDAE